MEKSLYDISWKCTEEEYRADHAYSYSTLARFNKEGFSGLSTLYDKIETPSLTFGSMVDAIITGGMDEYNKLFEIASFPKISDSCIKIAKILFNDYHNTYNNINDIPDNILAEVGKSCDYYKDSKYASYRVKKIKEECDEYYKLLFLTKDKTIVSVEDHTDAMECAEKLKTDRMTSLYFKDNTPFDDWERFYQLKFKGEYNGIPLRCMADCLLVNKKEKIIIPCDLKTSSKDEWSFHKSFIEWSYFIQAQLYWEIINQNLKKDEYFKDFTLRDYRFIVINRKNKKPLVWEYKDTQKTDTILYYGRNLQYKCRNWRDLVEELHYYLTNNSQYPKNIDILNDITTNLNEL